MLKQVSQNFALLAALLPLSVYSSSNCTLIGPDFPPPSKLSSSISFHANTSYSLEVFSTHESISLLTKHHAACLVASYQYGTKKIDSDTVYRIGSNTKVVSTYTFLIQAGETKLNDPITKYVPEPLEASISMNATNNPIDCIAWDSITIRDPTSHLAGIRRDFSGFGELDGGLQVVLDRLKTGFDSFALGLPPLNFSQTVACAGGSFRDRAQFFAGFTERHPVYAPGRSPIYSNAAFQVLGYVLENITGVGFGTLVQNSVFTPLKLTGSSWDIPTDNSAGIIPDGFVWGLNIGDENPAGGMFTTPNNLTALIRSIMTSTLLPPSTTRRWLKPLSFLSDPLAAVGGPWEIFRYFSSPSSRVVDAYTKSGDIPGYASMIAMIPDWDVGFTILAAGDNPIVTAAQLSNMIIDTLGPALETVAREEADSAYSGTYAAVDKSLNSTITINTDPDKPGLGINSWISNGTDMLASAIAAPSARLYPSGLTKLNENGETEIVFRAVFEDLAAPVLSGTFGASCSSSVNVDFIYWAGVANDEFIITVNKDGVATSVSPRILRVDLVRV